MEQFKLKSIEEFDNEFVAKTRAEKAAEKSSVIPEISKEEPANVFSTSQPTKYFNKPEEKAQFTPKPVETEVKPRPLTPIGQNPVSYAPVAPENTEDEKDPGEDLDFSDGNYGEVYVEPETKKKKSKGALAIKIISIVLLCVTVLTFVFGCFISIFLDNNGTSLGSICFNTLSQDIESLDLSKGDLIISSKPEAFDYQIGDLISVPASDSTGCDINSVTGVTQLTADTSNLTTTAISNGYGYTTSVTSDECYGVVASFYIPALGGLLNFAMENLILVCVLFILLSALWCLILVMVERKPKTEEKKN